MYSENTRARKEIESALIAIQSVILILVSLPVALIVFVSWFYISKESNPGFINLLVATIAFFAFVAIFDRNYESD